MNPRSLIVIVLALVCGLSAVFLVKALRNPVAAPTIARTGIVYAVEDVRLGEVVGEKSVELRQVPAEDVPDDAIKVLADAVGRVARSPLDKGDVIRERKLAARGASQGIAALIPPGMRPFAVQLPPNSTPVGNFKVKDRVDVILMENLSGGPVAEGQSSQLLLQEAEVFMVGGTINPDPTTKTPPEEARLVTLLVTPDDARRLSYARTRGTLDLLLRNPNDRGREVVEKLPPPEPVEDRGMVDLISPGMRAFTIDATYFSSALVDYIVADQRVDVLLTSRTDEEYKELTGGGSTRMLMENVKVLAVHPIDTAPKLVDVANPAGAPAAPEAAKPDKPPVTGEGDSRCVTLEVTPEQAQMLDLGQLMGKLHLALRGSIEVGQDKSKEDKFTPFPGTYLASAPKQKAKGATPPGSPPKTLTAGELNMVPRPPAKTPDAAPEGPKVLAKMQVRTLRGTQLGADSWTLYEATNPARARPTLPTRPTRRMPPPVMASDRAGSN